MRRSAANRSQLPRNAISERITQWPYETRAEDMGTDCFIISPIGAENSPQREHADEVLRFIIKPALEQLNLRAVRADEVVEAGSISKQMYRDILSSKFCIAILTGFNPNVFYELAIAQCAAKPIVILHEKGMVLPFDVKDLRCIAYDLKPSPLFDGVYTNQLQEMIGNIQSVDYKTGVVFAPELQPLGSTRDAVAISPRAAALDTLNLWIRLVNKAKERIDLAGIGLTYWSSSIGMNDALAAAVERGCKIRIMTMDTKNPATSAILNPEVAVVLPSTKNDPLALARSRFEQTIAGHMTGEVRSITKGSLHWQLFFSDDCCASIPYVYSAETDQGPLIQFNSSFELFQTLEHEFESLWRMNEPQNSAKTRKATRRPIS